MTENTNKAILIQGLEKAVMTNRPIQLQVLIDNSLGYVDYIAVLFNKRGQQIGEEFKERLIYDKEASNDKYSCFKVTVQFQTPGYRTYIFTITLNGKQYFIKNNGKDGSILTKEDYPFFETFAYKEDFSTPDWVKGAIMYQIFPDTFNAVQVSACEKHNLSPWGSEVKWLPDEDGEYRNDRCFGGNLRGIIAKLPYLKKLGVTINYLTPIFASNSSNGYDIVDYEKINQRMGNWSILKELYDESHELGMYVILDCVFNHCNPENKLFTEQRHLFTGNFWWGYKHLAEFDMNSKEYRELLRKLLNLYLPYCDGIRFDVADNLPDDILRFIRAEVKAIEKRLNRRIYLLGEVWKNSVKGEYRGFLFGDELDATMNYQFADAIYRYVRWGDFNEFRRKIFVDVLKLYPKCSIDVLMNPLSTHDIPRIPNILSNPLMVKETYMEGVGEVFIWDYDKLPIWIKHGTYQTGEKRHWEYANSNLSEEEKVHIYKLQKLAVVMQYTLPGIPSIFAGDELGVTGLKDPFNRTCMPWEKVSNNELLDFYIKIGEIRTRYRPILAEGNCKLVFLNEKVCIYKRTSKSKSIYCVVNRTDEAVTLQTKLNGDIVFSLNGSTLECLNPHEALIVEA